MVTDKKLVLLKQDLQLLTSANDEYLKSLLVLAEKNIEIEGIKLTEGDIADDDMVVQYAAYLFRKRAAPETAMPRFLRYQLNNMLMHQKGAVK